MTKPLLLECLDLFEGMIDRDRKAENLRRLRNVTKARIRLKQAVLEKYGRKCALCGENNEDLLQIDHPNGGGPKDRAQYKGRERFLWAVLIDRAGKYRLLCANCNWLTRRVKRIKPSPNDLLFAKELARAL